MDFLKYTFLLLTPIALQITGLCFAVWSDPYIRREHRRIMLAIIGLILSLIAQDLIGYYLDLHVMPRARTITAIFGYSVRPVILLLFFYIVSDKNNHRAGWALAGVNAAVHLTALFSSVCFSITADNTFHRGPLGYTCHVVSGLLLIELIYLTLKKASGARGKQILIPLVNALLIVGSVLADSFVDYHDYPLSFLTITVVSASVFYYIWLHLLFVREHERSLMAEQRIQIMLSQIKPHFLYNTLGTIEELCDSDPQTAKTATVKFARYLRGNMSSLSAEGTIPFEKELDHTRLYLDLEQLRFEDALTVRYNIECIDFYIPTLTLEPLVENAVRHGVRANPDGRGTVTVASRETQDAWEVTVTDDGPGFDLKEAEGADETHVGLRNVRERLKSVCGGTLRIESQNGKGTVVKILLPK